MRPSGDFRRKTLPGGGWGTYRDPDRDGPEVMQAGEGRVCGVNGFGNFQGVFLADSGVASGEFQKPVVLFAVLFLPGMVSNIINAW